MIRFSHVYKTYPGPVHALSNVDLDVKRGEFLFLTGPSGAGKTTLFRLLSGFDKASSGSVEVAGFRLNFLTSNSLPLFRRKIGVVFQDFRLLKGKSVFENIGLPLTILGDGRPTVQKKVDEMMESVGLRFKKDHRIEQLSGGEQQRVAIARALIHRPELLIADEPTGNLDPDLREEIVDLFERVNAQGTTVLIATHDHTLVTKNGRRRINLSAGTLNLNPGSLSL